MQNFRVGDVVKLVRNSNQHGLPIGTLLEVTEHQYDLDTDEPYFVEVGGWCISFNDVVRVPVCNVQRNDVRVEVSKIGDLAAVTISGHLTKDDVQSILNLIF